MSGKVLTVGLIIVALLLGALVIRNGSLAWMAVPFLVYLGAGILTSPSLEKIRLTAVRSLDVGRTDDGASVDVTVAMRNDGPETLFLTLFDPPLPGLKITRGNSYLRAEIASQATANLEYTFQAQRGNFNWQALQVAVSDPLGLFPTHLTVNAQGNLQIQPRPKKFQRITLRPNSTLHSPGSIPAHLGGSGTDFWGVREYHPGDSLRWLDWRLTARHPNQLYTREFEQEEIADIVLILDARGRTELRLGEESLFERNLIATASLAETFIHQGHRLALIIFGERMMNVFPGYGKVQLNHILRSLARIRVGSSGSTISLDYLPLRTISSGALVIVLSPLAPNDWPVFPRLRAHGNQVLLICPNPIDFIRRNPPGFAQDPATKLAVRLSQVERHLELRKIARLNIAVIDWQVNQPLSPLVRGALARSRGQRER